MGSSASKATICGVTKKGQVILRLEFPNGKEITMKADRVMLDNNFIFARSTEYGGDSELIEYKTKLEAKEFYEKMSKLIQEKQ